MCLYTQMPENNIYTWQTDRWKENIDEEVIPKCRPIKACETRRYQPSISVYFHFIEMEYL